MQAKPTRPCSSREHIESVDEPGHCVWCDAPMHCQGLDNRNAPDATSLTELINRFDAGQLTTHRAIAMAYDLGSRAVLQLQQGAKQ